MTASMSSICRRFQVSGRVQGVFFRETTRGQAESLGLTGYAVNMANGRVEVLACGQSDQVERLAQWLWQGSAMARVSQVEELASDDPAPASFTTGWQ